MCLYFTYYSIIIILSISCGNMHVPISISFSNVYTYKLLNGANYFVLAQFGSNHLPGMCLIRFVSVSGTCVCVCVCVCVSLCSASILGSRGICFVQIKGIY